MATVLNSLGHYVPPSSQNHMLAASSGYAPQMTSHNLVPRIPNISETGYGGAPAYSQTSLYPLQGQKETLKAPPPLGQHYYVDRMMNPHPYSSLYHGIDINAIRRKNATRETTGPLKAWLKAHRKNPYPTKGEKVMLAIATRMTLTQVSTWFANARRRMKKDKVEDEDEDEQESLPDTSNLDKRERSGSISSSVSHYSMSDGDTSKDLSDISDIDVDDSTVKKHRPIKKCVQRLFSPDPRCDNIMDPSSSPDSIMSERLVIDEPTESRLPTVSDVLPNYTGSAKHEVVINSGANSQKPKIWSISEIIGSASSTLNTESISVNPFNYTVPYSDYFSGYSTYSYPTIDNSALISGYCQSLQHFDNFSNSQNSLQYL